jgi:hypothetical protein
MDEDQLPGETVTDMMRRYAQADAMHQHIRVSCTCGLVLLCCPCDTTEDGASTKTRLIHPDCLRMYAAPMHSIPDTLQSLAHAEAQR